MSEDTICVILAAGEGKRMKSASAKVLHTLLGKPLLKWVVDSVLSCGITKPVLVVGHGKEQVKQAMGEGFSYVIQEKQLGTGHALMCASPLLENRKESCVLVLSGDTPLISPATIGALLAAHREGKKGVTVMSFIAPNPFGYGRIIRDQDGALIKITEERDASCAEKKINEVNSGVYCFEKKALLSALLELTDNNDQHEYYLTDAVSLIGKKGTGAAVFTAPDPAELSGVNDREQLYDLEKLMKEKTARALLRAGVWIEDIQSTFISPDAQIDPDVTILPCTRIVGGCRIAKGCVIGPNSVLENVTVGEDTKINASQCYKSKIGSGCAIGPFVHIRPDCEIGNNLRIGNFVEVKNSKVGDNTKISHLTYVGDCDAGENINFGCGTVIVNYDGHAKYRTTIGNNVFIGCNANLVAPITIHDNSYIAAGSTVTQDVPSGSLAIARARQVNKEGWVSKREGEGK